MSTMQHVTGEFYPVGDPMPPAALLGETLRRGVYVAPWMGAHGELVLLAVVSGARLACEPLVIAHGADRVAASDVLWDLVDASDPVPRVTLRAV